MNRALSRALELFSANATAYRRRSQEPWSENHYHWDL